MATELRAAGLFAGIGGLELGLEAAGFRTELLCEVWEPAKAVLESRFPDCERLVGDVREIRRLPDVDLVAAGFPCQDLSQAGRTAGIEGRNSGLVSEVFRLIRPKPPRWLLLENVPFMLRLDRGAAMTYLTQRLEELGYRWAYRVVDVLSFGLPQRRKRVLLVASLESDPRCVLFGDEAGEPTLPDPEAVACGFYWTEGSRGLGWAVDAVPTLKGGSTIGIPSPPAIRLPGARGIVTPDLRDAERLQGFPADWTKPAEAHGRRGVRWKLVGNAVSVPMSTWVASRIVEPRSRLIEESDNAGRVWPDAAWGEEGRVFRVDASHFPIAGLRRHLETFLDYPTAPLSPRATAGFYGRASKSSLRFPPGLLDDVASHLDRVTAAAAA